ncbi:MAG: hypothetical protein MJ149_00765 [Clostridia bacterium]|nr:hypothetical protein [Clostridia bacterium]
MEKLVDEVGMKLSKPLEFYKDMLVEHGFTMEFFCTTHDVYYTKETSFDGFTENEIKRACVRFRNGRAEERCASENIFTEADAIRQGYKKVFDTTKKDYHFNNGKIKSRIQLQEIENVGLLVYYDNPDYYCFDLDTQREKLLKELNSYGFEFNMHDLGLDKLRTLYYKKEMFSKNQNG